MEQVGTSRQQVPGSQHVMQSKRPLGQSISATGMPELQLAQSPTTVFCLPPGSKKTCQQEGSPCFPSPNAKGTRNLQNFSHNPAPWTALGGAKGSVKFFLKRVGCAENNGSLSEAVAHRPPTQTSRTPCNAILPRSLGQPPAEANLKKPRWPSLQRQRAYHTGQD